MTNICRYKGKYNELTRVLMESLLSEDGKKNLVISPLSVITLLCMAARAAGGDTREEILSCISDGRDMDEMTAVVRDILELAGNSKALKTANAVYVRKEMRSSISEEYIRSLKEDFSGELVASDNMAADVNRWVKDKTDQMIDKIMDDSAPEMLACLLNAVAFEADWEEQYGDEDIYEEEFTNSDGTRKEVEMLHSTEWSYVEDENYTGFVKPYKGDKYSFMAVLPRQRSAKSLKSGLKKTDFSKLFADRTLEKVEVSIPEFSYTFGGDITDVCRSVGMKLAFEPDADFTPMTEEWIKIDRIIHKAHVELDRKGTKAAAVTAAFLVAGCAFDFTEEVKRVDLDRPFVYAIIHNGTSLPVFTGVVNRL